MVILKNKEKSCGVVVVKDGKVLLVKHGIGHYGFPKGHMEVGETPVETAIREVKEETNVDVVVDESKRYEISYYKDNGNLKEVTYFLGSPLNNHLEAQEGEITEVFWADIDKVADYLGFNNIIELWNNKIIKDIKEISN